LAAQTAMESLKQAMGGSGRITQAEFKVFQQNNPNIELDPRAIDKIYEFADANLQVNLAISLHAPTNELRTRIMKINRVFPIETIMKAVDYYLNKTHHRITFEYILLKDLNDTREHAIQLVDLIGDKRHLVSVNLIPYNPVDEHQEYQRSEHGSMLLFYDALKKQSINCSIRLEHGTDIDAACGQLRSKQIKDSPERRLCLQ